MKLFFLVFGLIIFITNFLFNGCAPTRTEDRLQILSAERLFNKLEANRMKIKNFEGYGTLSVNTPSFENSSNFHLIIIKPDSIFLNILGPFGIELAQVLVTNKNFIFYDALSNTAYTGKLTDEALQNIFRVDIPFSDMFDLFTGSVNFTNQLYRTPKDFKVIYDQYKISYLDSVTGISSQYTLDVRKLGLTEYILKSVNPYYEIVALFSQFELIDNIPIPNKIVIENKTSSQRLELYYKKININQRKKHINFVLPEDAEIVKW